MKRSWQGLSSKEKAFIFFALPCSFLIALEYSLIKPIANSIFLTHYASSYLPYLWLITLPLNFLLVSTFNRFLDRIGPLMMFLILSAFTLFMHVLLALFVVKMPILCWVHNIWKDLYILLMLQQLWSLIHLQTHLKEAKFLYTLLFAMGGLGSTMGSLVPRFFAISMGSEKLLLFSALIFIVLAFCYERLVFYGKTREKVAPTPTPTISRTFLSKAFSSPSMRYIVLIVVLMQVAATILDFSFNAKMAQAYPVQDIRTEKMGGVWSFINFFNLFTQFIASFFLIHKLGIKRCHILLPMLLFFSCASMSLLPSVFGLVVGFSTVKVVDYSLFNLLKEMLYVPLSDFEKKNAKAFVDVFAYRSSKGIASLIVIGLQTFFSTYLLQVCSISVLMIFVLWAVVALTFFRSSSTMHALYAEQ